MLIHHAYLLNERVRQVYLLAGLHSFATGSTGVGYADKLGLFANRFRAAADKDSRYEEAG
jgi:hypothetical protein